MARLRNLLHRAGLIPSGFQAELAPEYPFVAIGDIHGRDDLLVNLLEQIKDHAVTFPLVFVGDYVDRGPDSAQVLARLMTLSNGQTRNITCLMGNHERMMLDFLDHSDIQWLRNGGIKTLSSFGISVPDDDISADALRPVQDQLTEKMGPEMIDWLHSRPLLWQSGNVAVTHAGADPRHPIEPRRGHGLLWGHPDFLKVPRRDGLWVVHGHFIAAKPSMTQGRINVDTGAFNTNRLTAAVIKPGSANFLTT